MNLVAHFILITLILFGNQFRHLTQKSISQSESQSKALSTFFLQPKSIDSTINKYRLTRFHKLFKVIFLYKTEKKSLLFSKVIRLDMTNTIST